jgi:hypothetical protein
MRRPLLTLALTVAVGAVALTGCTAATGSSGAAASKAPAASSQTVEQACTIASETMSDVSSDFSDSMSGLGTGDVSGALDAMNTLGAKFDEAQGKITNAKVKSAIGGMADEIGDFTDILAKAKDGGVQALAGDADAIQSIAKDMQASQKEIADLCS